MWTDSSLGMPRPEHFATVHGEYLGGVREAQRILG